MLLLIRTADPALPDDDDSDDAPEGKKGTYPRNGLVKDDYIIETLLKRPFCFFF